MLQLLVTEIKCNHYSIHVSHLLQSLQHIQFPTYVLFFLDIPLQRVDRLEDWLTVGTHPHRFQVRTVKAT